MNVNIDFAEILTNHGPIYSCLLILCLILFWWYQHNRRIFFPDNSRLSEEVEQRRQNDLAARKQWIENRHFETIYLNLLGSVLDTLTRFTCDQERFEQHTKTQSWPESLFGVQPFTEGSYLLCLRLALIYPWMAFFIVWILGGSGEFSGLYLFPSESALFERLTFVITFVFLLYLLSKMFSMKDHAPFITFIVAFTFTYGLAFAGAFADAFVGVVAFTFAIVIATTVYRTTAFAVSVSVAIAFAFAFIVAFIVTFAIIRTTALAGTTGFAYAFGFAVALAGTIAGIVTVIYIRIYSNTFYFTTSRKIARYWFVFNCFFLSMSIIVIAWTLNQDQAAINILLMLIFLVTLPLINALMDWLSLGFTRGFLYAIRQRRHSGIIALLFVSLDVILALAFLMAIVSLTVLILAGINAATMHSSDQTFLDLKVLFDGLSKDPLALEYTWIHFMMLSTLIPTLIHFAVAGASAMMIFPNKWRDSILQKWHERGDAQVGALWYVTIVPALGLFAPFLALWGLYAFLSAHGGLIGYGLLNWARELSMVFDH